MAKGLADVEPLARKFATMAEKAVAGGASVIIPLPVLVSQVFFKTGWPKNHRGATLLDPVAVATKMAEIMV